MMDPLLVVFDLDGTLLNDKHDILNSNIHTINALQKRGVLIALSTSRSKYTLDKELGLICPDIVISSGGSQIEINNDIVLCNKIEPIIVQQIICFLNKLSEDIEIAIDGTDAFYWNHATDDLDARWNKTVFYNPQNHTGDALKMCIHCNTTDLSQQIQNHFPQLNYTLYSGQRWLQITNTDVNKANALCYVSDKLHIPLDSVIAFGDDYTDCDTLKIAGIGVAMENANDIVKSYANIVVGSNNTDSITKYFDKLIK